MKSSVTQKLFLSILMAASLAVIIFALIMQWNLHRGFLKFVNIADKAGISHLALKLEESYRVEGNWHFIQGNNERWWQLVADSFFPGDLPSDDNGHFQNSSPPHEDMPPPHHADDRGPPPPHHIPHHVAREFDERLFLLNSRKLIVVGKKQPPPGVETTPLRYRGAIVGYLGMLPRTQLSSPPHKNFLKEQELAFSLTAGVIVILSALLSLFLATRFVKPLQMLAAATHKLSAGSYSVRVPVTSGDELGKLANDFNSLAHILEMNEQARRQWVADISHELRTPISILRAEIEAIQDGIRQPDPHTIMSLHGETIRLGRLVDDLYQLSLSDLGALSYKKTVLNLPKLLAETVTFFRTSFRDKEIALHDSLDSLDSLENSDFLGDPERLRQLFSNLLDNCLKYTDPGGTLLISLTRSGNTLIIDFQDSSPGVPTEALDKLFQRLYRVEVSRNRSTGGAGLGLAICRNIVDAHSGTITAKQSPLGGLWIRIEFPIMKGATA